MKSIISLLVITIMLLGCAHAPLGEHLVLDRSFNIENWQVLHYENFSDKKSFTRYYVPPGRDNLKSWSELVVVGEYKNARKIKEYVEFDVARLNARCPGSVHKVLESDTYNVYYTHSFPSCGGRRPESQIGRVIQGNEGIYHVSYSVPSRGLTQEEKQKWLAAMRKTFVANGDHHEKVR